ncbi:MAG: cytochrome c [Parafilimonas sp.]|nr:cytochrome c [Parafilimonas sp.]
MLKKIVFAAACITALTLIIQGCAYHKGDVVYPSPKDSSGNVICDTTNIRYSIEIKAILDANCKTCHDGDNSISGFNLYDYPTISSLALDGQFTYGTLLSAVMHEGGAPPMPDGLPMIDDCSINQIAAWVHAGAPNN